MDNANAPKPQMEETVRQPLPHISPEYEKALRESLKKQFERMEKLYEKELKL